MSEPEEPQEHGHPWDQLPDEPNKWYVNFLGFKDLGRDRTMKAAQERVTGRACGSVSGAWRRKAAQFKWVDRSKAWDAWMAKRASKKHENQLLEIDKNTKRGIAALTAELAEVLEETDEMRRNERLKRFGPILVTMVGKGKAAEFLVNARKALFGQKIEVSTPHDIPLDDFKDFDDM